MNDENTSRELEAAVLRRLLRHLDDNRDIQNIDLMIAGGFCRNCLGRWYAEAANERGIDLSETEARERIYGMPYADWKKKYQKPATEEQLRASPPATAKRAYSNGSRRLFAEGRSISS